MLESKPSQARLECVSWPTRSGSSTLALLHLDDVYPTAFPNPMLDRLVRLATNVDHARLRELGQVLLVHRVDR
jgi:hypothetical protein